VQKNKRTENLLARDGKLISDDNIIIWSCQTREESWKKFSDYIDCELQMHRDYFTDSSYAPGFICTCSDFFKNYICMHCIGIAALLDK